LFETNPALIGTNDGLEQVHRAPFHDDEAALVKEMDDDRNRKSRDATEESEVEEGHGATRATSISGGSSLRSQL
jgi:hypothetical protein